MTNCPECDANITIPEDAVNDEKEVGNRDD